MDLAKFCVYEHWRPDKDVCFYVGKGTSKRALSTIRRENSHYCRISDKLKNLGLCIEVRIFKQGLFEKDAFALEIERIAHWRRFGPHLVNQTDGGDGSSGNMHSDETKAKISAANKGRKFPARVGILHTEEHKLKIAQGLLGRKVSEETRAKISNAQKGKPRPELIGRKLSEETITKHKNRVFSEEHRRKISEAKRGVPVPEERRKRISETLKRKAELSNA